VIFTQCVLKKLVRTIYGPEGVPVEAGEGRCVPQLANSATVVHRCGWPSVEQRTEMVSADRNRRATAGVAVCQAGWGVGLGVERRNQIWRLIAWALQVDR